ncbi:helix-turn-helix transcriptional regulator [Streptomyces sp. NPDC003032]
MDLLERDAELALLGEEFEQCLRGRSRVVVIDGAPGSGKTALVRAFTERAEAAGALLLHAGASRTESTIPLSLVEQLFQGTALPLLDAERVNRLLVGDEIGHHTYDGPGAPPPAAGQLAPAVLGELYETLQDMSTRQPVVLAVGDVQFTDRASLQYLLHLIRRLRSSRILAVLSGCLAPGPWHCRLQSEMLRLSNCRRVRLRPLTVDAVATLLGRALDADTARRLAGECHKESGGSPLLARALVADQAEHGRSGGRLLIGPSFAQALLGRLFQSEPRVLEAARALAVLGENTTPSVLGRLLGTGPEEAATAIQELESSGLPADRYQRGGARTVVLGAMSAEQCRVTHSRAARILHEEGAPAPAVAGHLVASGDVRAWGVPILREAAGSALADGDLGRAVGRLRLARAACTDPRERALVTATLCDAMGGVNLTAAKRYVPELMQAVRQGHLTGRHGALTLGYLMWYGQTDDACEVLDILRSEDSDHVQHGYGSPSLDSALLWLPTLYPGFAGLTSLNHPSPASVKIPIASVWAPHRRAAAALNTVLSKGPDAEATAAAQQILHGTRLDDTTLLPIVASLLTLVYADRPPRATELCEALCADTDDHRAPIRSAVFALVQAVVHERAGAPKAAEEQALRALTVVSPDAWGVAVGVPLALLVMNLTAMGKYQEAAAYLDFQLPAATFDTLAGPLYLRARGHFHLATGRFVAALRDFEACGAALTKWGFDTPQVVPWRSDAAQALVCTGAADRAAELVTEQLARLAPGTSRTRGITLRAQAATLEVSKRGTLLWEAVDNFRMCRDELSLAYALADLSRTHEALGEYRKAHGAMRKALTLAERCHAEPLRSTLASYHQTFAASENNADGQVLSSSLALLSDAENRVAVLASEGFTNQQIANRLYITVSTVEQHLTRVYRKLSVSHRSELPSKAALG